MPPVIVPNPTTVRGPIESEHNDIRDAREKQFVSDKIALEAAYRADLHQIRLDKEAALVAAGFGPDGSIPPTYGRGVFNTVRPSITGTAQVGQVLTAETGTWTGSPSAFTYRWARADDAEGLNDQFIEGAVDSTYTPSVDDVGKFIKVVVDATAENAGAAESPYTSAVVAA